MKLRATFLIAVLMLMLTGISTAELLGFHALTSNYANSNVLEDQFAVDVSAVLTNPNQVKFTFYNVGLIPSSITDVYFDDGTLLGIASVLNGPGVVDFSPLASPGNLPSANSASPAFETTAGFSADSNSPTKPNGVANFTGSGTQEWVAIIFNLKNGGTFADVISELHSGELRIGLHVQGEPNGQSDSYINNPPPPPVPEPASMLLLGSGMLGLAGVVRRRLRR